MKKVTILGQVYKIRECTEEEYPKLRISNANGLCECYSKEIVLDKETYESPDPKSYAKIDLWKKRLTRHEIIHAFFHESGMADYRDDEKIVEWLALQMPKIFKAFEQLEIME